MTTASFQVQSLKGAVLVPCAGEDGDLEAAIETPQLTVEHPAMWAITYDQLLEVREEMRAIFGLEESKKKSMRDVNEFIIKPVCQRSTVIRRTP
jgi:hypothetical protein